MGFKRQVVFRIGADDWPTLEAAAREHGSIQAAVLAGIRALNPARPATPGEAPDTTAGQAESGQAKAVPKTVLKRKRRRRETPASKTPAPSPEPAALDADEEIRARDAARLLGLKTGTVSGYIRSGRLSGRYDEAPTWLGWLTTRGAVSDYQARRRG